MIRHFSYPLEFAAFIGLVLTLSMPAVAQDREIAIATWSGFYGTAQEAAIFKPFTRATGIGVRIVSYDGDLGGLSSKGGAPWTAVDMERGALDVACAEGRVKRIDAAALLGAAAKDDFIPGTRHLCGIASVVWTQAVAFDGLLFKEKKPTTLGDFFDLVRFPGKRGLSVSAVGTLEMALLADGVPRDDVYDILRRPGGVDRALAKLNTLKGAVAFWQGGDEAGALLDEGKVVMTTAYPGHFLRPREGARRPVGLMRAQQLWRAAYWAIPRNAPSEAASHRFISFATDPTRLADLATRTWFGPARGSGLDAVPVNARAEMPTVRRHFHDALQIDAGFWKDVGDDVEAAYAAWRRKYGSAF